jgi:hypothetical protein
MFSKEIVAGICRRPKWVPDYDTQADSGSAYIFEGSTQVYAPSAQVCSRSTQVGAVVAYV